jgi:hypothetical protein
MVFVTAPALRPRWTLPGGHKIADEAGAEVRKGFTVGLLRYVGPRTAVVHDVLAARQLWSQDVVAQALDTSHGLPSFLDRLTAVLLDQLTPDQRNALEVALATGYWHPQLGRRIRCPGAPLTRRAPAPGAGAPARAGSPQEATVGGGRRWAAVPRGIAAAARMLGGRSRRDWPG